MTNIRDIETLRHHLAKGRFNNYDILPFLVVLRSELEARSLKEQFKWLNLFCNWAVHPKLESSMLVVEIMQSFLTTMIECESRHMNLMQNFNNKIINSLRADLIQLLLLVGLENQFIKKDETFVVIFHYILDILQQRSLLIPSENFIKQKQSRITKIEELQNSITLLNGKYCQLLSLKIVADQEELLVWKLETSIYIDIVLPITYCGKRFKLTKE